MTILQSIILGIVQGITEFIPISSSGHLVLVPNLLGWQIPHQDAFIFNVLIQVATLLAVIGYYWKDLKLILEGFFGIFKKTHTTKDPNVILGFNLFLATIPAGVFGLILNGHIENVFASPKITAFFLFGTAILLIIAEQAGKRKVKIISRISWQDAVWIGFFQVLALFPGISRSGATIAGGMLKDLGRRASARFSFLMAVPITAAAGAKAVFEFLQSPNTISNLPSILIGGIFAAVVGYFSIRWLLNFLSHRSYYFFAGYCIVFAIINLMIIFLR